MAHIFVAKGHGASSTEGKVEMTSEEVTAHNAELTRQELAHWSTAPDTFGPAYYDTQKGTVTTWTGSTLGTIIDHRVYQHNFGARMVSMRVRGNNGATYYGRASWDNGNYIKLRKVVKR